MRIPLENMDYGSRPSIMPKLGKNGMVIKHIPNEGGK